jgi:amidase
LIKACKKNEPESEVATARVQLRKKARDAIHKAFDPDGLNLDFILAPADSALAVPAAVAGYPLGVTPLGILDYNGRPFGLCFIGKAGAEEKMLRFMVAFESLFPVRGIPKLLAQ